MSDLQQRNEERIRSRGYFDLFIEGQLESITATIRDVSPSGLCLETRAAIPPGTAIRLENGVIAAAATVRYCRQEGEVCRLGVNLLPASPA